MAMPPPKPARLYCILAREADVGVIFRRGPSKQVLVVKWDTRKDEFEFGQWFKGRIYADRGDLSPDGKLMLYFAANQSKRQHDRAPKDIESRYRDSWIAISKPPYLTALGIWFEGGTWFGCGQFENYNRVLLPGGEGNRPRGTWVNGCPLVFGPFTDKHEDRLLRDGWTEVSRVGDGSWPPLEKRRAGVTLLLERSMTTDLDQYELFDNGGNILLDLVGAEWADWDQHERLVFARAGCLFAATKSGAWMPKLLIDLNDCKFERKEAPDWARRWS